MLSYVNLLQQDHLKNMYRQHGVNYVGLFGSTARGEAVANSDVDLLVDFDQTKSLFDLASLKISLQDVLGKKVDLTMRDSIKKILEPYIKKDLITVYEKN